LDFVGWRFILRGRKRKREGMTEWKLGHKRGMGKGEIEGDMLDSIAR
jgi:hypothetical protein